LLKWFSPIKLFIFERKPRNRVSGVRFQVSVVRNEVTVQGFNVQRFRVAFPLIPALYAVCRCVRTGKDAPLYDL